MSNEKQDLIDEVIDLGADENTEADVSSIIGSEYDE